MSSRYRTRRNILASRDFEEVALLFANFFEANALHCHPYALIGGLAVAYYSNPLTTVDVDFLIWGSKADLDGIAATTGDELKGWRSAPLVFPGRRKGFPRHGLSLRRMVPTPAVVDVLATGEDDYLVSVVERAVDADVSGRGLMLPVARAEDLAVIKFLVGRDKDIEDATRLMGGLSEAAKGYVYAKIAELE